MNFPKKTASSWVPACAVRVPSACWLVLGVACSDARVSSPDTDASIDDASTRDASFEPTPSACRLTEPTVLGDGPEMSTHIETDGQHVYYLSSAGLQRVPLGGGASDILVESAADFALAGRRLFIAPLLGGIEERLPSGELVSIVSDHSARSLEASVDRLYFCDGDSIEGNAPFFSLELSTHSVVMHTTSSNRIGCVKALGSGAYWLERSAEDGPATRVMRMGIGQGIDTLVEYNFGFGSAVADDRSFALTSDAGIVLGAVERAPPRTSELASGASFDHRFVGEHLYFNRTLECTPMPNFGNGSPGCIDELMRVGREGGELEQVIEAPAEVGPIAVDDACVYWVSIQTPCHPGCQTQLMGAPLPGG
jgi:hypothetical protein